MAKLTIDQKIARTEDAILKEELIIEQSKEKIKNLKEELKKLTAEKEHSFTVEVLKLMRANSISQEVVLKYLKDMKMQKTASVKNSVSDTDSGLGSKPENSLHYQNAEK